MSSARDRILARLQLVADGSEVSEHTPSTIRHNWDRVERIRRFRERMEAVCAEVHLSTKDDWLELLGQICRAKGIDNLLLSHETEPGNAILARAEQFPELRHYDKAIEQWKEALFKETDASFTTTVGGIAETGSLILWPNRGEPRLMSLVPPIHIALLESKQLYTTFAEALEEQRWVEQGMPTNALLISGPSKSADIEQTLAYGVHGPKELVVIIV